MEKLIINNLENKKNKSLVFDIINLFNQNNIQSEYDLFNVDPQHVLEYGISNILYEDKVYIDYNGELCTCKFEFCVKSSKTYFNPMDIFPNKTWKYEVNEEFLSILDISKAFKKVGFDVYFLQIDSWRRGYDYCVYNIEDIEYHENSNICTSPNIYNYKNIELLNCEYFAILIKREK